MHWTPARSGDDDRFEAKETRRMGEAVGHVANEARTIGIQEGNSARKAESFSKRYLEAFCHVRNDSCQIQATELIPNLFFRGEGKKYRQMLAKKFMRYRLEIRQDDDMDMDWAIRSIP